MSNQWPRGEPPPDQLDDAIDRAVRAMMNVDPRPGLKARVLARLGPSPAPAAWFRRAALAGAVLAAVLAAVFLLRPAEAPTRVVPQVAEGSPAAPSAVVPAPTPDVAAPVTAGRVARPAVTSTPIAMPRVSNVFGARSAGVAVAASAELEEVVFTEPGGTSEELPGVPPLIVVPRIVVAPLQLERIGSDRLPPRK